MSIANKGKTTSVKLDQALSDKLTSLTLLKRRDPNCIMREAIRETAISDAKKAWESYKQTSSHITLNEFDAWVDRLATDNTASIPECHK